MKDKKELSDIQKASIAASKKRYLSQFSDIKIRVLPKEQ